MLSACFHDADDCAYKNLDARTTSYTKVSREGLDLPHDALDWACIRDEQSQLIWEKKTSDGSIHDVESFYRWGGVGAEQKGTEFYNDWDGLVLGTNDEMLCDVSDWRVPNRRELEKLALLDNKPNVTDSGYFPNLQQRYWTTSLSSCASEFANSIDFIKGDSFALPRNSSLQVRLVSGS